MRKTLLLVALIIATSFSAFADKGMWLPSLISSRIKDMKSKGFNVTYSDDAITELVKLGVSDKYGAREMQKAIETNIKRMVTRKILNDTMPTRCVVVFKNGKFDIEEAQVIDIPEAMSVVEANS